MSADDNIEELMESYTEDNQADLSNEVVPMEAVADPQNGDDTKDVDNEDEKSDVNIDQYMNNFRFVGDYRRSQSELVNLMKSKDINERVAAQNAFLVLQHELNEKLHALLVDMNNLFSK